MAVPFSRLATQVLDAHNLKLHDSLKEHNGIIAVFGDRGAIQFENGGGENFKERILYGENSNIAFRGKNSEIPTVDDDGITMATVPQKVISGATVINRVERDQVRGRWAIGQLLADKKKQAQTTYVQKWSTALTQATPGANDPYTLLPSGTSGTINGILSPVVPASAAGTTAGISRADNDWWRNQYTNTSIDMATAAGDTSLYQLAYAPCVFGASKMDEPDFGITDAKTIGDMGSIGTTQKRGALQDQRVYKLGFSNIMYYNATLIRESSTRLASKIAFVNTNFLKIKVLRSPGMSQLDQDNQLGSIPAAVDSFQRDINSLNLVSTMYAVASFVPMLLRVHGLADNIA